MSSRNDPRVPEPKSAFVEYRYSEKFNIIDIKVCQQSDWVAQLNSSKFRFKLLTSAKPSSRSARFSNCHQAEIISVNSLDEHFDSSEMLPAIHSFELQLKTLSDEFPISVYKESREQAIKAFLRTHDLTTEFMNFQNGFVHGNKQVGNQDKRQQNGPTNNNTNGRNNVSKRLGEKIDALKSKVSAKQRASEIVALLRDLEKSVNRERLLAMEEQFNI